jgi:hypothetical protein
MTGVLLDSSGKPARPQSLTILVPKGYEERERELVGRCLVPGCGARFYAGEEAAWQKHVGRCARANIDRIKAATEQPAIMEDFDPEVSKHMRDVGERMIDEGRLEVRPSERAGFS